MSRSSSPSTNRDSAILSRCTGCSPSGRARGVAHTDRPAPSDHPRWQTIDEEDRVLTSVHTSASGGFKDLYLNGYVGEVAHFLECLRSGTEPQPSAADNVKTMALCDRIIRAIGA